MSDNKRYVIEIRSDGKKEKKLWLPEMGLLELQEMVGGYIETVPTERDGYLLIVNEDGKSEKLPKNRKATELLPHFLKKRDYIAGTAVLMKRGAEDVEPLLKEDAEKWLAMIP